MYNYNAFITFLMLLIMVDYPALLSCIMIDIIYTHVTVRSGSAILTNFFQNKDHFLQYIMKHQMCI